MHKQSNWLIIFICVLIVSLIAAPSRNPDANFYYGIARRISRGEFLASIDGLTAPLLSWLLAPFLKFGLQPHQAYRIVNSAAFALIIVCAAELIKICNLGGRIQWITCIMLAIQILQFTIFQVSADVLAAAIYAITLLYWLKHIELSNYKSCISLGFLGALGYYAKPAQFFVFLGCVFLFMTISLIFKRMRLKHVVLRSAVILITCSILCLPWVLTISHKYGMFVISAQQFVTYGDVHLRDYTPDLKLVENITQAKHAGDLPTRNFYLRLNDIPKRLGQSWQLLKPLLLEYYFGFSALVLFLFFNLYALIVALRKKDIVIITIAIFLFSQVFVYLVVWGARFRFYYPALSCMHVLFAFGLCSCLTIIRESKVLARLNRLTLLREFLLLAVGIILVEMFLRNYTLLRALNKQMDSAVINYVMALPDFESRIGVVTGNSTDNYAGYIAHSQGREFWNSIDSGRNEDSDALEAKLNNWNVEQVIWFGEANANLDQVKNFNKVNYQFDGKTFSIYSRME